MKKKILIWMSSMYLGGAERALIGLLNSFDYNRVEIDLFLHKHEGELFKDIPKEVNLLPENLKYKYYDSPLSTCFKKGYFNIGLRRLAAKYFSAKKYPNTSNGGINGDYKALFCKSALPKIQQNKEYDLAISFITPHYFVTEKVRAKKKIAWIHTDYTKINVDKNTQNKMWSSYDRIISISDDVTQSFLSVFPQFKEKILIIENILPVKQIIQQSKEFSAEKEMSRNCFNILSVGRFGEAKNFDNVPEICKIIRENGLNVKWYIIGYGNGEQLIKNKIKEFNMEDYVIILGKKNNPYPYIKACDLYVQPSRYEGKAVTVREAQVLCKPVVITDFPTAQSQLRENFDGIIVPMDNNGCAEGIINLINNKSKIKELINNCRNNDFSGKNEIDKIYNLLGI